MRTCIEKDRSAGGDEGELKNLDEGFCGSRGHEKM